MWAVLQVKIMWWVIVLYKWVRKRPMYILLGKVVLPGVYWKVLWV